jgi:hypothetical protein
VATIATFVKRNTLLGIFMLCNLLDGYSHFGEILMASMAFSLNEIFIQTNVFTMQLVTNSSDFVQQHVVYITPHEEAYS